MSRPSRQRLRRLAAAGATCTAVLAAAGLLNGCGGDAAAQTSTASPPALPTVVDALTPVVAVAHTPSAIPVSGNDGKTHLVYELRLMNARAATSVHRNTGLPVNGDIRYAQRYAIDWMRLNDRGFLVEGTPTDVTHYTAYGADVLAVADGTVVGALDTLDDQAPPTLPPPSTITLSTADGNHLVIDIGHGAYAFYAHLQKGASGVKVKVGDRVVRGQSIGTLGNSGNSSAPHLHFHVMDGPSVLGSNGLPFVIDRYVQSGQITDAMFGASGIASSFSAAIAAQPGARTSSLPLDQAVVDF